MANWNTVEKLESKSGASLAVRKMKTRGKAKAIIHINHGMAEHAGRYERFAKALAAAGYHVIAHDHRGHGRTTAPDAPLGVFSNMEGMQKVLLDCLAVNRHARETWPDLPLVWFGHSMGGIIGTAYLLQHGNTLDGTILWNFNVDGGFMVHALRLMLKTERAFKGSDVPSSIATKLTFQDWNKKFQPNRTDFDWLSRDEGEVDKYVADPLCGFPCSVGLWLDVTRMILFAADNRNLQNLRNTALPVNLLGGEADPSSMQGKSMQHLASRMRKAGMTDVTLTLLKDTRHETLNEINRDKATADLIVWLDERWAT